MLRLIAATAAITFTGCASVTGSTSQNMSVQTLAHGGGMVSGARCDLINSKGKWFITTPGSTRVTRSNDDMQVLCQKPGHEPGRAAVVSDIKGSMFGNIILGGAIGAIVDHSNGSAYEYPALVEVTMGPATGFIAPPTAQAAAAAPTQMVANRMQPSNPDQAKAEELARASCSATPTAYSMGGGPGMGMEQFNIACDDGRQMRVRCDAGVCRELGR